MAETTRALITDDDVVTATTAATDDNGEGPWAHEVRDALEAIAPRLRARWVAEALDEAAEVLARSPSNVGMAPPRGDLGPEIRYLTGLAAKYRAGTR